MATTRYVHATRGVRSGQFDTPAKAARSVGAALRAASDGDTIVILDAATYAEGELVIDRPLTLTSAYLQGHPNADPSDPRFDPRLLPALAPAPRARQRVLRVSGKPDHKLGPVVISGLRVVQGHAVHRPGGPDPALGAGGGIAVVDADDVRIERCVVTGCQTECAPFRAWPEPDRRALRQDLVDLVDVLVPASAEAALNNLIKLANILIANLPGRVPAIPLFDRAALKTMISAEFDGLIPPGHPIMWLAGQAFGGGVAAVWSSLTLRNCRIQGNRAEGRGSGVAVVGYGWPTVDNCWIDGNRSGARGRLDGGGIGAEICLPGKLTRDLSELELIMFLRGKAAEVRARLASAGLPGPIDLMRFAVWLADPTQPPVITDNVRRLALFLINGYRDPEQLVKQLFYVFSTTALALARWDAWNEPEIKAARTRSITVKGGRITGNECGDDGGGLYCSVMSRISVSGCRFERNSAPGAGGGARLTMGSAGTITDCVVDRNVCGTRPGVAMSKGRPASSIVVGGVTITRPAKPPEPISTPGGGGISVRNGDLTLTGTTVGSRPLGNLTSDHPGGGVLVYADTEGDMGGVPDMWTAILREVFEVRAIRVSIGPASRITGNGAGFLRGGAPVGRPMFAKGGGVFILRGTFPDAPDIEVSITDVRSTVRSNTARVSSYVSRVAPRVLIKAANEICIQDLKDHKEWTETNNAPLIKGGTLRWP
ncbi:right-handed parallel beta-helix repeat-containing protein [Nonomuraea jiangxiensis]|uniref:Right handed beta helix region n=1 Tax=Nonomuraea jiangxiensis TaxID=633440 RepID=A0A1G9VWZ6_9ACTN|nr:right-handed parallel beta-helix repeat-containing protein [Nonomuraea jiangxiensis]SDM76809.1 Right handed beta helix region [Nonomuraea jiangxiensis]